MSAYALMGAMLGSALFMLAGRAPAEKALAYARRRWGQNFLR